jgi:hypothetical protein
MLFRTSDGTLINIIRYDFKNDKEYFKQLMKIKNINKDEKKKDIVEEISKLL